MRSTQSTKRLTRRADSVGLCRNPHFEPFYFPRIFGAQPISFIIGQPVGHLRKDSLKRPHPMFWPRHGLGVADTALALGTVLNRDLRVNDDDD